MEEIIIIGGGGHARACIDVIEQTQKFKIAGIVESNEFSRNSILDYPVIGSDEDLDKLYGRYKNAFIGLGQVSISSRRKDIFNKLKDIGYNMPIIVSPNSYVSKYAKISEGTVIMNHAVVNSGSAVGSNCILNNKALIEHDVKIGNNCHISTGAIINGDSIIGSDSVLGSGSIVNQSLIIKSGCLIGSGAVITKSIEIVGTYVGIPAKLLM